MTSCSSCQFGHEVHLTDMWMPIPEGFWMLLARGWTSQYGTAEPGSNVGAEWMGFSVELREPKYRAMPRSCRLTATQSPELGIQNQNCLFWQPNSVDFPVPAGRGLRGKLLGYTIPCTQMAVSVMCPSHAPFTSFAQCSLNHRVPRLPAFTWNHLLVSKQSPAEWEAWAEAEEPLYGPASARNALWLQWAPPGLQPATGPDRHREQHRGVQALYGFSSPIRPQGGQLVLFAAFQPDSRRWGWHSLSAWKIPALCVALLKLRLLWAWGSFRKFCSFNYNSCYQATGTNGSSVSQ